MLNFRVQIADRNYTVAKQIGLWIPSPSFLTQAVHLRRSVLAAVLLLPLGTLWAAAPSSSMVPSLEKDAKRTKFNLEKNASQGDKLRPDNQLLYIEGRAKALEGDYQGASQLLEQALKLDPTSAFLQGQLAETYIHLGDLDRAEELVSQAAKSDSLNPEYHMMLGGLLAASKRYKEAKLEYQKALELNPQEEKAPLLLGVLAAEAGDRSEGITVLTTVLKKDPENYLALFYRAKIYLEMDDIAHAQADLKACVEARPQFAEAGMALGMLLEQLGQNDNAIAVYEKLQGGGSYQKRLAQLYLLKHEPKKALKTLLDYSAAEPEDFGARLKIGMLYFLELHDYPKASQIFANILHEEPKAANVRFYLGAVYDEWEKPDLAKTWYQKVEPDSTFYKESRLRLGLILSREQKWDEGLVLSRELVQHYPNVPEYLEMEINFLQEKKKSPEALALLEARLKQTPEDMHLLYMKGALLERMGQRTQALESMRRIITKNPDDAQALNFIGYSLLESGTNLEEAETHIQKAAALKPQDPYIQDSLGWLYFKQNRLDEALKHLEEAEKIMPEEPTIQEHLGDYFVRSDNKTEALRHYKSALSHETLELKDRLRIKGKVHRLETGKDASTAASAAK